MIQIVKSRNESFDSDIWTVYDTYLYKGWISIEFFPLNYWNQIRVDFWNQEIGIVKLYALFFYWFIVYFSVFKND